MVTNSSLLIEGTWRVNLLVKLYWLETWKMSHLDAAIEVIVSVTLVTLFSCLLLWLSQVFC